VLLEREAGIFKGMCGPRDWGTGDLYLTYRTVRNRRVGVLQLLSADRTWPNLYDPKLVALSADRLRFVGNERNGDAWVVQEWICEVVFASARLGPSER
jgi:hypothetical protein